MFKRKKINKQCAESWSTKFYIKDPNVIPIRLIANQIVRILMKTKITPNQVTVWKFILLLPLIAYFFLRGGYIDNIIALFLLVVSTIFDLVDGSLARMKSMTSKLGGWLDGILDLILSNIVLGAVTLGVMRITGNPHWALAGLACLFGQDLANVMMSYFEKKFDFSCEMGSEEFDQKFKKIGKISLWDSFLKNIITPTRLTYIFFFTMRYLLLLGVFFYRLDIFLIAFAIAINIRWSAMFYLYVKYLEDSKNKLYTVKFLKELSLKK